MSTNLATISTLIEAVPIAVIPNPSIVAAQLERYAQQADKAYSIAGRAVVDDQDSFDRVSDVVKGISNVIKELDSNRKLNTEPLDSAKARFMTLYGTPRKIMAEAKDALLAKAQRWHKDEERRRQVEAAAAEKAAREQAEALARATAAMGDEEGAEQIIAESQELVVVPEKVVAQGNYGATSTARKRPVGQVTDRRAFLAWALQQAPYVIDEIEIGKAALNRLAGTLLEADPPLSADAVPGFKFEYAESLTIR